MIRGSGPRPDLESFAFSVLMNFLRIRTQGSGSGFASHPTALEKFKHDILEEKRIRATFEWIRVCFLHFSFFKKDAVPGLRIETRTRTEVRIRASALALVP